MKLYRSAYDRKITGLCGGLGQMLDVDATIIRILLIILAVFTGGTVIFIYLLASLIVPKEPLPYDPYGYDPGFPRHPGRKFRGSYRHHPFDAGNSPSSLHGAKPNMGPYPSSTITDESSPLDAMMESIEKKALMKELEELRAKLAKYEKYEKGDA